MSADIVALAVGTLLAVGALGFVLYPLFFAVRDTPTRRARKGAADDSAIVALREIEFDRATGKLSDRDYAEMRQLYGARALVELRAPSASGELAQPAASVDAIEARVRAYRQAHRECRNCGLRPETDAVFCSTCGNYLDRACPACKSEITEPGAAFCSACGVPLGESRSKAFV